MMEQGHSVTVGSVTLPNPVMTASGTAGHGTELAGYFDLEELGAVVVKSLSVEPWAGNPSPRVHGTSSGMINSVGLQNPGIESWIEDDLPALLSHGARVVVSIWGRSIDEYREAATRLAEVEGITAVEVNVSCPNLESRGDMFAHDPNSCEAAISASLISGLPTWAKLSPNVTDIVSIAKAAMGAGAEALTLTNTLFGMVIDPQTLRPVLGNGGGGLSGPSIRPVAVRAVYDVYQSLGPVPIIGVGGITKAEHAVEFLAAGASAVQVGSAHFADPKASRRVLRGLQKWCRKHEVTSLRSIIGAAHES
ncbi:MAG: dihydroorotate dehydrogenase B catalytic subunit [Acidimicrobiaceae bacterium]|nr:dihydroorotate dehydrogenase B catalytic subunit [Acidimicrobiaceae bacterium]|tara:strand:- start:2223 stop:3143 length:921 start_codon:yes stop_codon:yes gene_type:complete